MDQDVIRFRHAADRENARRQGQRRRYSATLQQQAVAYWQRRRDRDGLRTIAAALGVAPWTLHRWTRTARARAGFWPIAVVEGVDGGSRGVDDHNDDGGATRRRLDRGCGGAVADVAPMRWHGRWVTVYAYAKPVDMRGFDGLSALVTERLQRDPLNGDVYIFLSRALS